MPHLFRILLRNKCGKPPRRCSRAKPQPAFMMCSTDDHDSTTQHRRIRFRLWRPDRPQGTDCARARSGLPLFRRHRALPYGSKSAETVARYAIGAAQFLEQHGAQMLVIACNTATALALDQITQASGVPVVGVVDPERRAPPPPARRAKWWSSAPRPLSAVTPMRRPGGPRSRGQRKSLPAAGAAGGRRMDATLRTEQAVAEQVARIYLDEAFGGRLRVR